MPPNRPKRLRGARYVGRRRYFLTSCTLARHPAFADAGAASAATGQLLQSAAGHSFEIFAYCFMPDHLHALVAGITDDSDFCDFVTHFKRASGFSYSRLHRRRLWQKRYYERILRRADADEAIVRYVIENPVRAGLARTVGEYPYAWPASVSRNKDNDSA